MGLIKLSLYTTRSHSTHVAFAFGIMVLIFNDFPSIPTQRNQPSSNSRLTRSTAIAWFDPLKTLPSRFLRLFPSPRFESKSLQTSPSMSCIFRFDFSSLQLSVHLTVNNSLVTILLFSWLEVLCVKRCFLSSSPCFPPKNVEKFSHVNFKKI
jgi:hypothetical protein